MGGNMADVEAKAKILADRAMAENLMSLRQEGIETGIKFSPNELRDLAKARSADEIGVYDMAVNLDRFLSKKIDSLRTMISMRKTELENAMHHDT